MPPQWANCPVCGRGHSTISPGQPCSSTCARDQAQQKSLGRSRGDHVPEEQGNYGRHRRPHYGSAGGGRHAAPGGKSGCFTNAALLLAGVSALLTSTAWGASELIRWLA